MISSGDPEAAQHEIYLSTNSKNYVGGEEQFEILNEFVESTRNHACLVNGEPGTGKTSLVSYWINKAKKHWKSAHFILHFVGCSSKSTTLLNVLQV